MPFALTPWIVAPALALDLQAPTGLKQDEVATFLITGGSPGQTVGLVYGGPPPGVCPPVLAGLCLSVSAPVLVDTAVVQPDGTAVIQALIPANAPLIDVRLQAAQTGPTPAVSPVRTAPVLTVSVGPITVSDAASLETARHVWSAMGLTLAAGPYPSVLSLPIETTGWVFVTDASRDVTLPGLVTAGDVYVARTPGARITAPSWIGPRVGGGSGSIETEDNTGPVVVSAPALQTLGYVQLLRDTGSITVSAAAVSTPVAFNVQGEGGDLSGVLPTLTVAGAIGLSGLTTTDLTFLPAVQIAESVGLLNNPGLVRVVRLAAPGVSVTGSATVSGNPRLTELSGWSPASVASALCWYNPALPSCACEVFGAASGGAFTCAGNAPDTCSDDPYDLCQP